MKHLFALLLSVALLTACDNVQTQGQAAAQRIMKENIIVPESYEAVETRVDSLYADINFNMNAFSIAKRILTIEGNAPRMSGQSPTGGAVAELESRIRALDSHLDKGAFEGWRLHHRYRAANVQGKVLDEEVIIFVDPEMKECRGILDLSNGKAEEVERLRKIIARALNNVPTPTEQE